MEIRRKYHSPRSPSADQGYPLGIFITKQNMKTGNLVKGTDGDHCGCCTGKYFPVSLGRSKCRVTGADFVSAKALDNTTMQVKVNYTPVTVLGDTALAGWSSHDSEKAVWKKVDYAPGYTLTLYGNDKVVKRMTVTSNSVSLKEYMTDPDKIYYYQVKAVPVTAEQKKNT